MPTASVIRRPPKTRPVTLATAKTAITRADTGQLLSDSRADPRRVRFGLGPVCRPAPVPPRAGPATGVSVADARACACAYACA